MMGEDIGWSRLYRDDEDGRALAELAEGTRVISVAEGWTLEAEPETPPSA